MIKIRDSQRKKVYNSEAEIPRGIELPTMKDMQEYVNSIIKTKWWGKNCPEISGVLITDGRRRRNACGFRGYNNQIVIKMPKFSRCQRILLHELAHGMVPGEPWHGVAFCTMYIKMINRFMGKENAEKLVQSFIRHKVEYDL